MNKLCIEMTHTRKKKDAKKARNKILRRMKTLMKPIEIHARNYHAVLEEKLEDEGFYLLQKRRGATEARIGIFKNAYLGTPLRSKGYPNRKPRTRCL